MKCSTPHVSTTASISYCHFFRCVARAGVDRFVLVSISDNGPGIPEEMIPHIFEPFFTTKERGKGTGLGLFVSHAILKKLGGKIQVQSEPGRGTTFLIDIPVRILPDKEASP